LCWYSGAAVSLVSLCCVSAANARQVIDFENLQTQVTVLNHYSSQGATFNGPLARDYSQQPGFAHSGTKAIELCFAAEFCSAPLVVNFTTAQKHVKLWVGYNSPLAAATSVLMQAIDGNGVIVGQATAVLNASNSPLPVQTPLLIDMPVAVIREITVSLVEPGGVIFNNSVVIDDVEFDAVGTAPPCATNQSPTVTLSQPLFNQEVDVNEFTLRGQASTAVPLDSATLRVTNGPNSLSEDMLYGLVAQTGGPFGPIQVDEMLTPGTNGVSVQMTNCKGGGSTASVVIYKPIAAGTSVKVLGMEVTQATQTLFNNIPMVAGKPTILRLYMSVEGPTTTITGVSGELSASRPGGAVLPNIASANQITIDSSQDITSKRLDITKSLNFVLPPDWYSQGTLQFVVSSLYVQSFVLPIPCDGCDLNLPNVNSFFNFSPTRPLKLILAPYSYKNGFDPDAFLTPMGALQWLNNVYPLAGNFPEVGSGVDLVRILPLQKTNYDLHSDDDGDNFLQDLDSLLFFLKLVDGGASGAHLLAMTPCGCGGRAELPGSVAYVDTWAVQNGAVPVRNFEGYGQIWAQEIAHNFGRHHASNAHNEQPPTDSSFPVPHGGIAQPGLGIITDWWNGSPFVVPPGNPVSGGNHAHDFMSYGAVNDQQDHTFSWVSPYTYEGLFNTFLVSENARRASSIPSSEKLVIQGRILANGKVVLRLGQQNLWADSGSGSRPSV
jgi:hypothetical protein